MSRDSINAANTHDEEESFGAAIARAKREAREKYEAELTKRRPPPQAVPSTTSGGELGARPGSEDTNSTQSELCERKTVAQLTSAAISPSEPPPGPVESLIPRNATSVPSKYADLKSALKKRKSDEDGSAIPSDNIGEKLSAHSTRDEVKERPAKRPFAPAKKPSKYHKPAYDQISPVDTRTTSKASDWYANIDLKQQVPRNDLIALKYIFTLTKKATRGGDTKLVFNEIRRRLHQMEFFDFLSGALVKKSKVLEDEGLPAIFKDVDGLNYPWDIRADAEALYLRWLSGVIDPHLLRGIVTEQKRGPAVAKRTTHKLDKSYTARVSCNYRGSGSLQNGQWWPMQICAMRDGAHGEIEAGIHGQPGKGAFSALVSSGGYDDKDDGDTILYCGTSGSEGKPSLGTNHLLETCRLKTPLRVLRSAALSVNNPYRPSKGLRFDGLYDVVRYEVLDQETAMHRFLLRRKDGQDPIRCRGVESRPTDDEIAAYTKIRGLLGMGH